jgi:hypothetical protein
MTGDHDHFSLTTHEWERTRPKPLCPQPILPFWKGPEAAALSVFHSTNNGDPIRACYHSFTIRQQFDTVPKRNPFEYQKVPRSFSVSFSIAQNLGKVHLTMKHAPWRNEPTELSTGIVDNENVKIDSVRV